MCNGKRNASNRHSPNADFVSSYSCGKNINKSVVDSHFGALRCKLFDNTAVEEEKKGVLRRLCIERHSLISLQ